MKPYDDSWIDDAVAESEAIAAGDRSSVTVHEPPENELARFRISLGLSQPDFAKMYGLSLPTLRKWEQGQRSPRGAAKMLLKLIMKQPETIAKMIAEVA